MTVGDLAKDFDESKHPRADDGKFGSGGGGGGGDDKGGGGSPAAGSAPAAHESAAAHADGKTVDDKHSNADQDKHGTAEHIGRALTGALGGAAGAVLGGLYGGSNPLTAALTAWANDASAGHVVLSAILFPILGTYHGASLGADLGYRATAPIGGLPGRGIDAAVGKAAGDTPGSKSQIDQGHLKEAAEFSSTIGKPGSDERIKAFDQKLQELDPVYRAIRARQDQQNVEKSMTVKGTSDGAPAELVAQIDSMFKALGMSLTSIEECAAADPTLDAPALRTQSLGMFQKAYSDMAMSAMKAARGKKPWEGKEGDSGADDDGDDDATKAAKALFRAEKAAKGAKAEKDGDDPAQMAAKDFGGKKAPPFGAKGDKKDDDGDDDAGKALGGGPAGGASGKDPKGDSQDAENKGGDLTAGGKGIGKADDPQEAENKGKDLTAGKAAGGGGSGSDPKADDGGGNKGGDLGTGASFGTAEANPHEWPKDGKSKPEDPRGWSDGSPQGTPVAKDGVVAEPKMLRLKKGLYTVGTMARMLDTLAMLMRETASEAAMEGDDSPVPGQLRTWLKSGLPIFVALAEEESAELLGDDGDDDVPEFAQAPMELAAWAGALRKAAVAAGQPLEKAGARHNKDDKVTVQSMHDHCVKLGAACADGADKVAKMLDGTPGPAHALVKAIEVNGTLEKALAVATTERDTVVAQLTELDAAARVMLAKNAELEKMFMAQPRVQRAQLRAVEKSADQGADEPKTLDPATAPINELMKDALSKPMPAFAALVPLRK